MPLHFRSGLSIVLALTAALALGCGAAPVAEAPGQATAPPKPRNTAGHRKFESTITAVDASANPPTVRLKNETVTLALKPTTKLVQEERGLAAADLKVGDIISLITLKPVKGPKEGDTSSIKEESIVTAVNPLTLTLKIGDVATLTVSKVELAQFNRATPIQPGALKVGQTVAVKLYIRGDGDIDVQRLAVVIENPKVSKPRTPRPKTIKPKSPQA